MGLLCICTFALALAQDYPARSIRIVVPFPPGALNDLVARTLGQRMQEHWSQPVLVENRPGGGTIIGTEAVAKAAPDGYTLLLTSVAHAITPSFFKKLPYDSAKSFAPISLIAVSPFLLVVRTCRRSRSKSSSRSPGKSGTLNLRPGEQQLLI